MGDALKDYFPKQQVQQTSRIAALLAELVARNASIDEKVRDLGREWEREHELPLRAEQKQFIGPLLRKIQEMAIAKATREEARIALLDAMMSVSDVRLGL